MAVAILEQRSFSSLARRWADQCLRPLRPSIVVLTAHRPSDDAAPGAAQIRDGAEPRLAERITAYGELDPQSCAMDLLSCAIDRAERHPHRTSEIIWTGDGDLRGVLAAQPTPANLSQRFCSGGPPDDDAHAEREVVVAMDRSAAASHAARDAAAIGAEVVCRKDVGRQAWLKAADRAPRLFEQRRPASLRTALAGALDAAGPGAPRLPAEAAAAETGCLVMQAVASPAFG